MGRQQDYTPGDAKTPGSGGKTQQYFSPVPVESEKSKEKYAVLPTGGTQNCFAVHFVHTSCHYIQRILLHGGSDMEKAGGRGCGKLSCCGRATFVQIGDNWDKNADI
ncbi:hypothetical protein LI291_11335 [Intestinibacillus massiliensis]|nr:hypothetical protein [Intestinibacillus massiliensis]